MKLFDLFKSPKTVYWRDNNGNIDCNPKTCGCENSPCHKDCPVNQQTIALGYYQNGNIQEAIKHFKLATNIAPDFKDAWANLGTLYGLSNEHVLANQAFSRAYVIDNNYVNAITGLIVSNKNLGYFDMALKLCDKLASLRGEAETKQYRDAINDAIKSGKIENRSTIAEMATSIIKQARELKILGENNNTPTIPEIMAEAGDTCSKVMEALNNLNTSLPSHVYYMWGAYAGIGAVCLWDKNWDALKSKGIAETLLKPRGADYMDEYVIDIIGTKYGSAAGKKLEGGLNVLAISAISEYVKDDNLNKPQLDLMQAMYFFGMVYEMEKLGMK